MSSEQAVKMHERQNGVSRAIRLLFSFGCHGKRRMTLSVLPIIDFYQFLMQDNFKYDIASRNKRLRRNINTCNYSVLAHDTVIDHAFQVRIVLRFAVYLPIQFTECVSSSCSCLLMPMGYRLVNELSKPFICRRSG